MTSRLFNRLCAGLALALGLAAGGAQAAPLLSSQVADNGTITGPQAYTLSHATHSVGVAFTDSYRFTLGTNWAVNEVSSYFNLGGGMLDFVVRLYSVALNQETLIASDITPTLANSTSRYDFAVPLASAGAYRLEISGTRVGQDYTGSLSLSPPGTVPEPDGLALLAAALVAMGAMRRRSATIARRV